MATKKIALTLLAIGAILLVLLAIPQTRLMVQCKIANGEIRDEVIGTGIGEDIQKGCYPKSKTQDAGTHCAEYNLDNPAFPFKEQYEGIECQGECIWLGGDVIQEDVPWECSSYQKPYFIIE